VGHRRGCHGSDGVFSSLFLSWRRGKEEAGEGLACRRRRGGCAGARDKARARERTTMLGKKEVTHLVCLQTTGGRGDLVSAC
jgi:hypothetical protein